MHDCAIIYSSWLLFLSFNIVCHAMSCQQARQQGKKLKKIWFLTISFRTSELWSGQVNFFSLLVPGQANFFNISTGLYCVTSALMWPCCLYPCGKSDFCLRGSPEKPKSKFTYKEITRPNDVT